MAIFKKISILEGNPMKADGTSLVFTGLYFQTENESDIEFLRGFKQYSEVDAIDSEESPSKPAAKASTGTISAASLAKMAAQNK